MSAANRSAAAGTGHVRHADDSYATPNWCTRAILPLLPMNADHDGRVVGDVLDPCCGEGAILDCFAEKHPDLPRWGIEIDDGRVAVARMRGHNAMLADALSPGSAHRWTAPQPRHSAGRRARLIVSNPPFGLAIDFVRRSLEMVDRSNALGPWAVCMLLRLNWLASQGRADFLRANTPSVHVLPRRPSFTLDGKTDATDYAWMCWSQATPTVTILTTEARL